MKNITAKCISVLMSVIMCFTLFSVQCFAALETASGHITINAFDHENNLPLQGMGFRLYFVASAREEGNRIVFDYTDEFAGNGMDISNIYDSYFPVHLMSYAEQNGFSYILNSTDESGAVVFSSLRCGIYLAVSAGVDEVFLNPLPFIVTIPLYDESPDDHIYNVTANPKININHNVPGLIYVNVKKQWQGQGEHPDSIDVTLLCDGIAVNTVELNESNNWSYRWDNLQSGHSWNVVETDVPQGYEVSYETSQLTIVITNTAVSDKDEKPDTETTTKSEDASEPDKLVQTGQLNWPVPVLATAGLLLFSIGWAIVNFGKKEEEMR